MRWLLVLLAACSYAPTPASGPTVDGPSAVDAPAAAVCFGQFATVCLPKAPTQAFALAGASSSVTTDILASCDQTAAGTTVTGCVISATNIMIDGTLTGIGTRPLILVASGSITIPANGLLDVASHRTAMSGAGADPAGQCTGGAAATVGTSAGGAGGSLFGRGGNGGTGFTAGTGALPNTQGTPATLRGGCAGSLGGNPAGALGGGAGGGALLLIAGGSITVAGLINASGAGGDGGAADNNVGRGGAGGGSGGMIVFDGASLTISGGVWAQGGGGGEGNNTTPTSFGTATGNPGADAVAPGSVASGGDGAGAGHGGGDGATTVDGNPGDNGATTTGGGGGGGAGFIKAVGAQPQVTGTVVPDLM